MKLSVLMSVYNKERPAFLRQSLDSLVAQNVQAGEVVIVKDGPLGEDLKSVLASYGGALPIVTVQLEKNLGLGPALSVGLRECQGELVARVDSDDICLPNRFEKQLTFLECNPTVDVVGGATAEFWDDPTKTWAVRRLPCGAQEIRAFSKIRNPINHMTVIYRKSSVLKAGGYRPFPGLEDYDLWARMLVCGAEFRNLEDVLVLVRIGNGMLDRRGGLRYFAREVQLHRNFIGMGLISPFEFAASMIARVPVRLAPACLRSFAYRTLLRHRPGGRPSADKDEDGHYSR
ncbi:MAG: glycosyltransferase [Candidatus Acidiferrales bacterium]